MSLQTNLEYILNFDYTKLFKGVPKNYYVTKEVRKSLLSNIEEAKDKFAKKYAKVMLGKTRFDTPEAFKYCNLRLTDTPEEALCYYILHGVLDPRFAEYERFVQYVVDNLKEYEKGYKHKYNK